jgi:GNAT superfamily N-acetyltransferase
VGRATSRKWRTGAKPTCSASAAASGDVAALVLCVAYPQDWHREPVEAWVSPVGTRRAWRGKGVGRWLLAEALRRVAAADDGFERAMLGVDEENPTGALRLYRALGFQEDVRRLTILERASLA